MTRISKTAGAGGAAAGKPLRVQLGCFDRPADGWLNTDITPHIRITRVFGLPWLLFRFGLIDRLRLDQHRASVFSRVKKLDLRKTFPFADGAVEAFFCSHVLEHLYLFQTRAVLDEVRRCLKPGGFARFVLPDLDAAVRLYRKENPDDFLQVLFQRDSPAAEKNRHKWMYTAPSFIALLREHGFDDVRERGYRDSGYPPFLPLDNRPEDSFYVEAVKD
ncbi:MAG: methyltransferase domain-containing protein [Acidobacteriota bacterium]|nr:methyltransferase domain-containing protein [Acidobacteriota bacterium]